MNDDLGPPTWVWRVLAITAIGISLAIVALGVTLGLLAYNRQSDLKQLDQTLDCRAVLTADYDAAVAALFVSLVNGSFTRERLADEIAEVSRLAQLRREPDPCVAERRAGQPPPLVPTTS